MCLPSIFSFILLTFVLIEYLLLSFLSLYLSTIYSSVLFIFVLTEYLLFCFVYLCVLEKKWFCYVCLCFWIRIENHFWCRYAACVCFIDLVLIRIEPIGNHFDNKFQKWSNFLPLVSMIFSVWFPPVWLFYIYFFLLLKSELKIGQASD